MRYKNVNLKSRTQKWRGSVGYLGQIENIKRQSLYYYNHKYDRVGHLFQERFKSQPVNDFSYFITLLRYIHQNPLKAMLVDSINEYEWSSWQEYNGTAY